ncbi:MAG: sulfotransferase, partial [Vicinamibacteria bacterium]
VLADMFPSMRAVCIVRDPRDVVVSNLEAGFAESMGPLTAALEWRESVIAARRFAAGSPGTMAFVSYEDLVSEAAPAIMDVCGHVGVSFEEQMLRPHDIAERYAPKQSWMRGLDEPITSRRVRRWPGLLDRDTLATIEALNFEEMVACGYHPESSPRRLRHAKTFVRPLLEAMDEWASVKSARRSDVVELKRGAYRDLLEQIGG